MSSHRRNKLIFLKVIKGMFKSNFAKVKLLIWSFVNHGRGSESPSFDSLNYRFQRQTKSETDRKKGADRQTKTNRQTKMETDRKTKSETDRQTDRD